MVLSFLYLFFAVTDNMEKKRHHVQMNMMSEKTMICNLIFKKNYSKSLYSDSLG